MLIEMASFDPRVVAEIAAWKPLSYRDYFLGSPLSRAASAIAAYEALGETQRLSFERTVEAIDKLTLAAIGALQPPCHPQNLVLIGEVIGPAIRRLVGQAAAFLNGGDAGMADSEDTQAMVDGLIG